MSIKAWNNFSSRTGASEPKKNQGHTKIDLICRALFHHDDQVAIGAAIYLGQNPSHESVPFLLRALLTRKANRAQAIVWALGEIGDEQALAFLHRAVKNRFVCLGCLDALGKIGSLKSVDALMESVSGASLSEKYLALRALARINFQANRTKAQEVVEQLDKLMSKEPDRKARLLAFVLKEKLNVKHKKNG